MKLKSLFIKLNAIVGRICVRIKGVDCGRGVKILGIPSLKRVKESKIILGNKVTIISARWANQLSPGCPSSLLTDRRSALIEIREGAGLSNTVVWASEKIVIGEGSMIGSGCMIVDHDFHEIPLESDNFDAPKPVYIGKKVFIGARSIVLKGVSIGDGAVIGAGSVVVKDIPEGVLAGGNPCKIIKKL